MFHLGRLRPLAKGLKSSPVRHRPPRRRRRRPGPTTPSGSRYHIMLSNAQMVRAFALTDSITFIPV